MKNTKNTINNLNLIKTLIDAINTKTSGDIDKTCKTIMALPVMEAYYLFKGFKMARETEFFALFAISPNLARDLCRLILKELYYFGPEENNDVAYAGMGNIDVYVTAIKAL